MDRYTVTAEVWLHPGEAGWHFVTLPSQVADQVRARNEGSGKPFGSVPARIELGGSAWSTSLFPDSKRDTYLVPIKAQVRGREGIEDGDEVTLTIVLR
ncbi:MAG: DUF1905 domain-containing protein [Actinobacteria bacterium]|nr:DUF1905 domain-containing protein [Actinomycetota bacterium]